MKTPRYLVKDLYTADPSAHVFNGRIYIYLSHDIESGIPEYYLGDHDRRFFEASWMHKYNGKYYFSYSSGNTHKLCYAIGDNPYGPFIYQGVIHTPVVGWTTHHSICEFQKKGYLFHHDSKPSGGKTWLRSIKVVELEYEKGGTIKQ